MRVIKSHGSMAAAFKAHTNNPIAYGLEFRPTQALEMLMHQHPVLLKTKQIIDRGTKFPLHPIKNHIREQDLSYVLKYKNHKSANKDSSLSKHKSAEVIHGWSLPLPPSFSTQIFDAKIAPHGIIRQNTITELGEIVEKERVTHD